MPKGIVFWVSTIIGTFIGISMVAWCLAINDGQFHAGTNLHTDECPEH